MRQHRLQRNGLVTPQRAHGRLELRRRQRGMHERTRAGDDDRRISGFIVARDQTPQRHTALNGHVQHRDDRVVERGVRLDETLDVGRCAALLHAGKRKRPERISGRAREFHRRGQVHDRPAQLMMQRRNQRRTRRAQ